MFQPPQFFFWFHVRPGTQLTEVIDKRSSTISFHVPNGTTGPNSISTVASMTNTNDTNAIATIPQGNRYDDAIWEVLFEIWLFLADRNCQRTRDKFIAEFREHPTFQEDKVPSVRQLQYRAKNEKWDLRANDLIADTAKHIDKTQLARLWVMIDKAIDFEDRLISGEFMHAKPGMIGIMHDAAKEMMKLRGLGTAGVLGAPVVTVEVKSGTDMESNLSLDEKAELYRSNILREKQIQKLTGRKAIS